MRGHKNSTIQGRRCRPGGACIRTATALLAVGASLLACRPPATDAPTASPGDRDAFMESPLGQDDTLIDEDTASAGLPGRTATGNRPPKTIYRHEIDRALAGGPGYLLYQLGPEPFRVSGKFVGWQITQMFPDDPELCAGCDLRIGDVVLSVNGERLETPQAFSAFLAKLPTLTSLEVHSLRDEKRRSAKYAIVD